MAWTEPATVQPGDLVTAAWLNTYIRDNMSALLPIGTLILRAANYQVNETAVEGRWLQCNGVNVSRTTYSDLFTYLNGLSPALPFGSGDGSTTFGLPDLRGRAALGEGEHSDVDTMGKSDNGAVAARTPSHHHTITGATTATGPNIPYMGAQGGAASIDTSGSGPLDWGTPFQIAGSWFIKYTL